MNTGHDDTQDALHEHGRALRSLARSMLGSTDGADDVVQQAFATALAQPRPAANQPGWLVRVVQNLARRQLRDRTRRDRHHAAATADSGVAPPTDELLAEVEMHRRLGDAVAALREPLRRAIVLRYWHDLPPRVIARQLGMPVATVKTHLQRGLAEVRAQLDRREPDRRRWLLALVPIAEPNTWARLGATAPTTSFVTTGLWIMASKHVVAVVAALLCVPLLTWAVWPAPAVATEAHSSQAGPQVVGSDVARDVGISNATPTTAAVDPMPAREVAADGSAEAEVATCTFVGRIAAEVDDLPVLESALRLIHPWSDSEASTDTGADGRFELCVPRQGGSVPFSFALASAPGMGTRELRFDGDLLARIQDSDRVDLGTLRLVRGLSAAGRVLEHDGKPLESAARLLLWDPSYHGSFVALYSGRTVGFTAPDGRFALAERLSPPARGHWMLAAICDHGLGWTRIECTPGQQTLDPIEIRLQPGGALEVRVVDPDGTPITGAHVAAAPYFLPIGVPPMWEPERASGGTPRLPEVAALFRRVSDARGEVRFQHLPQRVGQDVLYANRNERRVPAMILSAAATGFVSNTTTADPATDGTTMAEITLRRQRTIELHGRVLTPAGEPVPGVGVRLNGENGVATADAKGAYRLPPHTYATDIAYLLIEGGQIPLTQAQVQLPAEGDIVEHDLVVEPRAPVTGRVVDQHGNPVAGAAVGLGKENGMYFPSVPRLTGVDGVFTFPDAVPSQDCLHIRTPAPHAGWLQASNRRLARRTDETIVLTHLDVQLVDLDVTVLAGGNGSPVSPTTAELWAAQDDVPWAEPELAHGRVRFGQLRPGDYLLVVRGPGELRAQKQITIPADQPRYEYRIDLWPPASITCRVDWSGIGAEAAARLGTVMVLLDAPHEESYATDEHGERLNLTRNTGRFRAGQHDSFVLHRVTPRVPLRLRILGDQVQAEATVTAEPGADTQLVLRPLPRTTPPLARPQSR